MPLPLLRRQLAPSPAWLVHQPGQPAPHPAAIWRAAWLIAWQNLAKQFSERHGGGTPAMRAGIRERPILVPELLRWRRFPSRIGLPEEWGDYYWGRIRTRRITNELRYELKLVG